MSPLRKVSLPIVGTVLCAALLLPATAGAQRPGRDCDRQPNDNICQQIKKRQEINDKAKGITPACRAAADKYNNTKTQVQSTGDGVKDFKRELKKAKSDSAKSKAKKGLKRFKRLNKKAKTALPSQKAAADGACAAARDKPYS